MSRAYPETVRLDLPATHKHLSILGACIAELLDRVEGLDDRQMLTFAVQLAVHEACTNIVDHAYGGDPAGVIGVVLTVCAKPRQLVVTLHDTGRAFDPAQAPAPDLNVAQEHGYGLFLINNLMDEVTYTPCAGNNRWRLVKQLDPPVKP